jgi:hypothetical protein
VSVVVVKRRPVRGALGGLLLGIGVGVLLLVYGKAPFGRYTPFIVLAFFFVLGIVIGLAGPVTRREPLVTTPQGPPPRGSVEEGPPEA